MNRKIYNTLIFELSRKGRRGYSLPKSGIATGEATATTPEIPADCLRKAPLDLPEADELTVMRHYNNMSTNNFGVDTGFYPLGSCTMKYNPKINEQMASHPGFANMHPAAATTRRGTSHFTGICSARSAKSAEWLNSPLTLSPAHTANLPDC